METPAREERAELLSQLSYLDAVVSVFVFQIDEVETNFLSEISISEFSHSQDPFQNSPFSVRFQLLRACGILARFRRMR